MEVGLGPRDLYAAIRGLLKAVSLSSQGVQLLGSLLFSENSHSPNPRPLYKNAEIMKLNEEAQEAKEAVEKTRITLESERAEHQSNF